MRKVVIVKGDQTNNEGTTMESLPSELISFIQQLRPLMRIEVFNSFCFLLMRVLIGEAKQGKGRSSVFARLPVSRSA